MSWADQWTFVLGPVALRRLRFSLCVDVLHCGNIPRVSSCAILRDHVRVLDLVWLQLTFEARRLNIFAEVSAETIHTWSAMFSFRQDAEWGSTFFPDELESVRLSSSEFGVCCPFVGLGVHCCLSLVPFLHFTIWSELLCVKAFYMESTSSTVDGEGIPEDLLLVPYQVSSGILPRLHRTFLKFSLSNSTLSGSFISMVLLWPSLTLKQAKIMETIYLLVNIRSFFCSCNSSETWCFLLSSGFMTFTRACAIFKSKV